MTISQDRREPRPGDDAAQAATSPQGTGGAHRGLHVGRYPVELPSIRDPRLHLMMVIAALQVLGQTVFEFPVSIPQILLPIVTCVAIEGTILFRRRHVITWPSSGVQAANGIGLIMRVPGTEHGDWWSLRGWWVFVLAGVLAMGSKYLIHHRGRHVFNPSNFALVAVFLVLGQGIADPQVLWWGHLSVGLVLAIGVILTGSIAITRRVGQGPMAVAFWTTFAVGMALVAASGHSMSARWSVGPVEGWDYWLILVTSPEILVFTFFMITDPRTTPAGRVGRAVFGACVAVVASLIIATQHTEFGTKVGLLTSLVILCPFSFALERRTPVVGTTGDRLHTWSAAWVAPSGSPVRARLARGALLCGVGAILSIAVVVLGARHTTPSADASVLDRRSAVVLPDDLPQVGLDLGAEAIASDLDAEQATRMGHDVVRGLLLESMALETADEDLAGAALAGPRLRSTVARIEAANGEPSDAPTYTFDGLTAMLVRFRPGHQTPPELAVRVVGARTVGGVSEPIESTFTLALSGDVHLITNEYDLEGNAIGDDRSSPTAEALEPVSLEPTADQLAGLSFADVTNDVGLDVPRSPGPLREGPAVRSGGVAVGDYDGDGLPDVFLTRVSSPNALLKNVGGRFVDVTREAGLEPGPSDEGSTGAMWVDLNGDGLLDLVVLGLGRTPNRLLLGTPTGRFLDATDAWGLPSEQPPNPDAASYSLAAADYDRDGRVDLLIVDADPHPVRDALQAAAVPGGQPCTPAAKAALEHVRPTPSRTRLLRNTGTGFEDRTEQLGVPGSLVVPMAARFADLDGDGWDDIVLAGRKCTTTLLRNDQAGSFTDTTEAWGADAVERANSIELIDVDGDGSLDLFFGGVAYPTASEECPLQNVALGCSGNHLLLTGANAATEVTDELGVRDGYWAWGTAAADINLDGRTDLVLVNGYRNVITERRSSANAPDAGLYLRSEEGRPRIWLNVDGGPWPDAASAAGVGSLDNARAVVPFDYDVDGRIDLLVVSADGTPTLLRNVTQNSNHWMAVRLHDSASPNTAGVGAVIRIVPEPEARPIVRRVTHDGSFQSGRPSDSHFGLGDTAIVSRVEVRWPDGHVQVLEDVPADQLLLVDRER